MSSLEHLSHPRCPSWPGSRSVRQKRNCTECGGRPFPQAPIIRCSPRPGLRPTVTSIAGWAGNKRPSTQASPGQQAAVQAYSARQPCRRPKSKVLFMGRSVRCHTLPTQPFQVGLNEVPRKVRIGCSPDMGWVGFPWERCPCAVGPKKGKVQAWGFWGLRLGAPASCLIVHPSVGGGSRRDRDPDL